MCQEREAMYKELAIAMNAKSRVVTYITSTDILHIGYIIVDNLDQPAGRLCNILNDVLESLLVESLRDPAGIHSTHRVVRSALLISLDSDLHGQPAVEHYRHQGFNRHHFRDRGKRRVLAKGVPCKAAVALNEALGTHVFEARLFHQSQGRLRKLRR
jgi:hypothetical protein